MRDDDLDLVLRGDVEEIEPSSGFTASVMEAVRAEAEAPPALAFPWGRAIPGLVAAGFALVFVVAQFARAGGSAAAAAWPPEMVRAVEAANGAGVGWVLGALVVAFISVRLGMRVAGARG